jgi:mRNA interferase RelE/StbE
MGRRQERDGPVTWNVVLTQQARAMLAAIRDRRAQAQIRDAINRLQAAPEQIGKPLTGELAGLRSLRAAGQRYRILYRVESEQVVVLVVALGPRKEGDRADVYELARKLLRLRLLEPPGE